MSALPQSIPSADWLTAEQILGATGISLRSLQRFVKVKGSLSRELPTRGRNGKPLRQYFVASLPAELRSKIEPAASAPIARPSPLALAPLFQNVPAAAPVRATLTDPADIAEASRREQLIRPLLDFAQNRGRFAQLRLTDGSAVTSANLLAQYICESNAQAELSRSTLWRWKSAYKQHGIVGLAPKRRHDAGRSRWAAANRQLADLAAYLYMGDKTQPGQSVMVAWEQVCGLAAERGLDAPSYETVRSFLDNPEEVSSSMKTLQLKGKRGYEAMFAGYLKRAYNEPANLIWVSDHMICDVLVQDDCFDRDFRHCRIQMTTLMDYRSRRVVGVSWCRNGSSHSIKRALLQAILNFGPPAQFYCDNGKDYKKVATGASREEIHQLQLEADSRVEEVRSLEGSIMRRLGIEVTFCKPFHPQSKHIEKYHRFFHERFDRSFPSYTAGATHLRPDATVNALTQHKKLVTMGDTRTSQLPLASEYIRMAEAWIEHTYHQRPHAGQGMQSSSGNDRSPAQCFAEEMNPKQKPAPPLESLALLMAETSRRVVRNCAVEIGNVRFVPSYDDERAAFVLHERNGQKVIVAYDPLDMTRAAVLDLEGYPLCKLERQALTRFAHDAETSGQIAGMEQQRGMLAKATRQSIAALGQRVRAEGYTSQVEQLRQIAQLPATGTDSVNSHVQRVRPTAPSTVTAPIYPADAVEAFFKERHK